jgi:hypothetical protein
MGLFHFIETSSILIHRVNIRVGSNEFAQGKRERAGARAEICPYAVLLQVSRFEEVNVVSMIHSY